ncbi:MAG: hypothetical protein KJ737_14190 [Proteobacteria bacterium]|nr:hypothetical protein [Pseudomonadota bacterium]
MLKNFFKSEETKKLEYVVKTLKKRNHENIRANLPGYKTPQNVVKKSNDVSFSPDITSIKNDKLRLFSIVTLKTIKDTDIPEKWSLFAEFASQNNAIFHIAFPPEIISAVKEKLEELGISASLWDIAKN